jgi:hypothetical protein
MKSGSKQEKYTGYSQPTRKVKGSASAPVEFTERKRESPVLKNAPLRDESTNSTGEVSASALLAVQVMMGDFKALKAEIETSWQASSNGKIYWCAEMTGHELTVVENKLFVDGAPVDSLLDKLLAKRNGKESI